MTTLRTLSLPTTSSLLLLSAILAFDYPLNRTWLLVPIEGVTSLFELPCVFLFMVMTLFLVGPLPVSLGTTSLFPAPLLDRM